MKPFTKQTLRRFFRHFFLASFLITFAVGHFIAENDTPTVSLKPVVTVPVIHKTVTTTDIEFVQNGSYEVKDLYFTSYNSSQSLSAYVDYHYNEWEELYIEKIIVNYNGTNVLTETSSSHDILSGYFDSQEEYLSIYDILTFNLTLRVSCSYGNSVYSWTFIPIFNYTLKDGSTGDLTISDLQNNTTSSYGALYNGYMLNSGDVDANYISYILNYSNDIYQQYMQYGIDYVLSHLNDYNLYTEAQYLEYGQSEYQRGRTAGSQVLSVSDMIREIFKAPISMFKNAFNFVLPLPDGTSLNVGGILTFFLTIGIALTIVQLISKIGGK